MALSGGGFGRGRRWAGTAEGLGTSLVILVLVAAVVYATSRPVARTRVDLTEGARYALEDQTRSILAALEEPVEIVTIFRPEAQVVPNGLAQVQARAADYVRLLLEEYVVAGGGRVSARHLDPHADRVELEEFVREFNLSRYNLVILRRGDRARQVFLEELATIDRGFAREGQIEAAELRALHGEGPLTSALLSIIDDVTPRIGFLVGHGEADLAGFEPFDLGLLANALEGQGLEAEALDLSTGGGVPPEFAAVAVIGPTQRLGRGTVEALAGFHEAGGALLLAPEPWQDDEHLDELLSSLGVQRERAVASRDQVPFEGERRAVIPVHRFHAEHPVSAPIARQGVFAHFFLAGGVGRAADAPAATAVVPLAVTAEDVFGDLPRGPDSPGDFRLDERTERRGARALVAATEDERGRAMVFGGAGALRNSLLDPSEGAPGNMDLALNSLNWLVQREQAVAARPRQVYESRVDLYDEEKQTVFLYVVVVMPLAGAFAGLLVWLVRRR